MLISHQYKFIFVKTEKTASTSIEDYLHRALKRETEVCRATPSNRRRLLEAGRDLAEISFIGWTHDQRRHVAFYSGLEPHSSLTDARRFLGDEVFAQYRVVTSERNPWDRQVSLYFHRLKKRGIEPTRESFQRDLHSAFYNLFHHNRLNNWRLYSIDGAPKIDFLIRFSSIEEDIDRLHETVGLPKHDNDLMHFRKTRDREHQDYRHFYDERTRDLVRRWYAKEIEYFGFEF